MHLMRNIPVSTHSSSTLRNMSVAARLEFSRTGRTARLSQGILATILLGTLQMIIGCGLGDVASTSIAAPAAISGSIHGGNQAVVGAHVFLYAVGSTTNGGAATSLLNSPGYVVTNATGGFNITSDYTCPTGGYVYLLATGGNPGLTPTPPATSVNNAELVMASGVGACPLSASAFYTINEVTTVATAYALAQFTTSETQIGAAPAYSTGIANAFGNIPNIISLSKGTTLTTTPSGNGTVPNTTLNSLANSLAACVNSDGTGTACSQLMSDANVTGAGGTPIDTFQAALNIAKNPGTKVSNIYNDAQTNAPFLPALTSKPNDWTVTVSYLGAANPVPPSSHKCYASGGGSFTDICQAQGIAIDATGNVWISNYNPVFNGNNNPPSGYDQGNVIKFSPAGTELSPAGGYTAPYFYRLQQIAFDTNNTAWVGTRAITVSGTSYPDALLHFTQNGVSQSYSGGGIATPRAVAVDAYNNIFAAGPNVIAEFTNAGVPVSGTGYQSSSLTAGTIKMAFDRLGNDWIIGYNFSNFVPTLVEFTPVSHAQNLLGTYGGTFTQSITPATGAISQGVAIDPSNNVWFSNAFNSAPGGNGTGNGFLAEYSNSGALLSGAGFAQGGVTNPNDVAIDGSGNVFALDSPLGELTNTGTAISPSTGYTSANPNDCCFTGAIDNSGNLWLTGGVGLYQMIGIATPVVVPVAATLH